MEKWQRRQAFSFLFWVLIGIPVMGLLFPSKASDDPIWLLWGLYVLGGFFIFTLILVIGAKYGGRR